jgi:hypothetical protein
LTLVAGSVSGSSQTNITSPVLSLIRTQEEHSTERTGVFNVVPLIEVVIDGVWIATYNPATGKLSLMEGR